MVFKNNFVVVVKCNGKILRERDEFVTLPFGSEYSILLKNLESRKAVIDIHIDGKDVLDGKRLIIQPNSELELKGFKKDGLVRNKFKFIKKTQEISDYRGDEIDDGMIRVEVTYEQQVTSSITYNYDYIPYWNNGPGIFTYDSPPNVKQNVQYTNSFDNINYSSGGIVSSNVNCCLGESGAESVIPVASPNCFFTASSDWPVVDTPKQDEGITVKGSKVTQKFVPATTKTLESSSHVIIIRLRGITDIGIIVKKAVTVRTKITCETCGKKNKSSMKYCPNCGTHL